MGYTLEAIINTNKQMEFLNFIQQLSMQQEVLAEQFLNRFVYNIPKDCVKSLSGVFEKLEKGSKFN